MQLNGPRAGALPVNGHLARVAAKRVDVLLDPLERLDLVVQGDVGIAYAFARELGRGEETQRVQAVVDGDDDDVRGLVHPVIEGPVTRVAEDVCAAVDVEEHGHWAIGRDWLLRMQLVEWQKGLTVVALLRACGRVDVQLQAVFCPCTACIVVYQWS